MAKLILILIVLLGMQVRAQSVIQNPQCNGVIHGTVLDHAGQPVKSIAVVAWPLGIDLAARLPQSVTDEAGAYRIEHVCPGKYAVVVQNKKAGYPRTSPWMNEFLYGHRTPEGKVTAQHSNLELSVYLPPKPGLMKVSVMSSESKREILTFTVKMTVRHQRRTREAGYEFKPDVTNHVIVVPPDKDVIFHVTAQGFREWRESAGTGKVMRVPSGTQVALEVLLEPLK